MERIGWSRRRTISSAWRTRGRLASSPRPRRCRRPSMGFTWSPINSPSRSHCVEPSERRRTMTTSIVRTAYLGLLVLAIGCDGWKTPSGPPASIDAELRQSLGRWGTVPIGPTPAQAPALVDLGQALMFDKVLSGNRDIACATCHNPVSHAGDGLALSIGTGGSGLGPSRTLGPGRQFIPRNAPTLLNTGLNNPYLFWDGRVSGFGFGGGGPFQTPAGAALPSGLPTLLAAQAMFP